MAKIRSKIIDRNRFTKKYPLIRAKKANSFIGETEMEVEVLSAKFKNESTKTVQFDAPFPGSIDQLRILLSPRDTTDNDSAMVTLAVDTSGTTVSQVKIEASAPFTGTVDIVVLRIVS